MVVSIYLYLWFITYLLSYHMVVDDWSWNKAYQSHIVFQGQRILKLCVRKKRPLSLPPIETVTSIRNIYEAGIVVIISAILFLL